MRWFQPKTLMATAGAVVLPMLALAYLASKPGRGSAAGVMLQVAIVIGGLVVSGLLLARLIEQMNAKRVSRWLESDDGKEWLESLPEEERSRFLSRFDAYR